MILTHTISLVEVLWTVFTLLGFLFNAGQLHRSIVNLQVLRTLKINSLREYAAATTIWMFGSWTFVQFSFTLFGLLAMAVPSPNEKVQPTSYIITTGFILISAILAISGYIIDERRKTLVEKLSKEDIENARLKENENV